MTLRVAIPSYKRADVLARKTYPMLRWGGVENDMITVFVASEEERLLYAAAIPEAHIVVGVLGLAAQRQFISNYFPAGDFILFVDDDISALKKLVDGKLVPVENVRHFITDGFARMALAGSRIWGIYPAANAMFMSSQPEQTTNLCYIIGAFYGIVNNDVPVLEYGCNQEDKERTLRYWVADRKLLRLNHVTPVTKYYAPGGMDSPTRKAETEVATQKLVDAFPGLVKKVKKPKTGIYDLRFIKQAIGDEFTDTEIVRLPLREGYAEARDVLLAELQKVTLPPLGKPTKPERRARHGTRADNIGSIGRTATFGWGRTRAYGIAEFSANRKFPGVWKALVDFGRSVVPVGTRFSAITLNHGVQARKHRDTSNVGNSVIVGIGDYSGGELRVWDLEDENYNDWDLRDKPTLFNGALLPHETQPFSGERYTIILYKQKWESQCVGVPEMIGAGTKVTGAVAGAGVSAHTTE